MEKNSIFTGCATAIVTPFKDDMSIDFDEFGKLIDFQLENGIKALVVCGTTGEASTLSDAEHISVIKYACDKVRGTDVKIIAGAGSNDTLHGVNLSKLSQSVGADALLHVTPYYNKTSQKGLIAHFAKICDSIDIPVILYNVPGRTGMTIAPETYDELADIPNIKAVKEAGGNFSSIATAMNLCGSRLDFYSGNDEQAVPLMSLGGKGVISVLSNVKPRETAAMCDAALNGDFVTASRLQLELIPLINALFSDVNPIPVKIALNLIGFNVGKCRLPLISEMDSSKTQKLKDLLL
ncbi:MAG: 4-hydroxy-tetrahydrodipicolinate synthase [Oscillospiraceae bacterium]